MEDAKTQRWILRTVSCSFLSDHPFNFYTMTLKMSHILQRTSAHLFLVTHAYNGSFHFIFQNFLAWFSTVDIVGKIHRPMQAPQNSMDLYRHKAGDCGTERARTQCSWAVGEKFAFSPELSSYPLCVSGFCHLCTIGKLVYSPHKRKRSCLTWRSPCYVFGLWTLRELTQKLILF